MHLSAVFVRFYKSFNYNYLRKCAPQAKAQPWEALDDTWYPHVRVTTDRFITTIVGENESGKSHLLSAIEKGVSGEGIEPKDFCRYSQFFSVEEGQRRYPEFGFEWDDVTEEESARILTTCKIADASVVTKFYLFRPAPDELVAYFPDGDSFRAHEIPNDAAAALSDILPTVFRIESDVALPESVSIRYLAGERDATDGISSMKRKRRARLTETIVEHGDAWFSTKETLTQNAETISKHLGELLRQQKQKSKPEHAGLKLAHDLIRKIARIDEEALRELQEALVAGNNAHASGIVTRINQRLDAALNFPKFWAQDKDFRLRVSELDHDLVFTIEDRTGTKYAFQERSSGLKYFLSYYIQYLAHEPDPKGRHQILVMDEPDAYLSSQGQQDLLKIFEAFAHPEASDRRAVQVVYVTHSPFLIDKNHAERIRVLEKGRNDEGTRVVRDVSRNHYEPLRSAFGSFVAETTFIGNCNLMVEGTSDQVLLAGAARHLRGKKDVPELETLDLNALTIVPSGGASQIPYLVYLARGRDVERPAVVVLLDSDSDGNETKKVLLDGVGLRHKRKRLLDEKYVLQIGDEIKGTPISEGAVATEDLVPLDLAVAAARRYVEDFYKCDEVLDQLTVEAVCGSQGSSTARPLAAIQAHLDQLESGVRIQKIGFARAVIDTLFLKPDSDGVEEFEANMRVLLGKLNEMQRRAVRERDSSQLSRRLHRVKSTFLQDHANTATRQQAVVFVEQVEDLLEGDSSTEGDAISAQLRQIRRDFKLDEDLTEPISKYAEFRGRLERLRYAGRLASQEHAATVISEAPVDRPVRKRAPSTRPRKSATSPEPSAP